MLSSQQYEPKDTQTGNCWNVCSKVTQSDLLWPPQFKPGLTGWTQTWSRLWQTDIKVLFYCVTCNGLYTALCCLTAFIVFTPRLQLQQLSNLLHTWALWCIKLGLSYWTTMALNSFNIDAPRWDQSTFMGRLKYFFSITDCRTALFPDSRLDEAKALVESCR